MWELVQLYMGEVHIVDYNLTLEDCKEALLKAEYIADGMANFFCETST